MRITRVAAALTLGARVSLAESPVVSFLPFPAKGDAAAEGFPGRPTALDGLDDIFHALTVLQEEYFEAWVGAWPSTIDWTAAVMGSHLTGALGSLSKGLELIRLSQGDDYRIKENFITSQFSQLVAFYFGQDAFAVRNQAFDDMLWVVLGWLDTIQFSSMHHRTHYQLGSLGLSTDSPIASMLQNQSWHGVNWTPAFAHRARTFWELASTGWDTTLCGGGMNWNPRLAPYKNAITNELFISASIAMYLYFPGDDNTAPFGGGAGQEQWKAQDPRYLAAAVTGYRWLTRVGLMNEQGLYTDGFHVSGYRNPKSNSTKCDLRDDMVYTYNQGVVLSGQLGLFYVTGSASYLEDGHRLIQSVINATGYDLRRDRPKDNLARLRPGRLPPWCGLGRAGILEEACDVRGDCSQDSHTFKGIFFHHLTAFCAPLDPPDFGNARGNELGDVKAAHIAACRRYQGWLRHNAAAALGTRDARGRFGMWWTAGLLNITLDGLVLDPDEVAGGGHEKPIDYRTYGVPDDPLWVTTPVRPARGGAWKATGQVPLRVNKAETHSRESRAALAPSSSGEHTDPNRRGRGRTVETQGGGLAVLRALWEVSRLED